MHEHLNHVHMLHFLLYKPLHLHSVILTLCLNGITSVVYFSQDLLEREQRNQDAIEAEKAALLKFTEVTQISFTIVIHTHYL